MKPGPLPDTAVALSIEVSLLKKRVLPLKENNLSISLISFLLIDLFV